MRFQTGHVGQKQRLTALLLLLLCVAFAQGLYTLPLNRIIERRLCRDYYGQHDPTQVGHDGSVDEALCKVSEIQGKLAALQGIMETAWIVGDFIITIPMGFVAERYGLRFVLWLNMVPRFCLLLWAILVGYFDNIFPTKAIIASPFLSVLGGTCVFESLTYALTANLSEDATQRSKYLAYVSSISYIVSLLGPAASAATMSLLLWLPLWIGLFLLSLAVLTIRYLPDTIHHAAKPNTAHRSPDESESNPLLPSQSPRNQNPQQPSILTLALQSTYSLLTLISHPTRTNLRLLLLMFTLVAIATSNSYLLVQYISLRCTLPIATAGLLLSLKSLANLTLLTILVPGIFAHAARTHSLGGPIRLNFTLALLALAISVLGAICIALSSTITRLLASLVLYAMGSALPVFKFALLRSSCVSGVLGSDAMTTTTTTRAEDGARVQTQLFAVAMLAKTLGSLVGAPLMAAAWVTAIKLGGAALGMPYLLSAGVYAVALGAMSLMNVAEESDSREE